MLGRIFLYERSKVHYKWNDELQIEYCEFCGSGNVIDNGDSWLCMDCNAEW